MISVETARPVYSNLGGKDLTPEEKKARKEARLERARKIYQAAKETGTLSALENIALRSGAPITPATDPGAGGQGPGEDKSTGWSSLSQGAKIGIIGGGILVAGLAVWYFGFRKPAKGK